MTQGGEAMGRDETGRVVFVPYAIAGEEVVAEIVEERKGYARARLVEIVQPSPARITPRCPHFGPPYAVAAFGAPALEPGRASKPVEGDPNGLRRGCGGC